MQITKEAKEMMVMNLITSIHRTETIFKEETRNGYNIQAMVFHYDKDANLLFSSDNVPFKRAKCGKLDATETHTH